MKDSYDILVIGTGPAGAVAAVEAAAAGLNTAVADRSAFGGTCNLRGCNPKKVLTEAAELVDRRMRMAGKGIVGECGIEWPELVRFEKSFTDPVPAKREDSFHKRGIDAFHGPARFTGPNTADIAGRKVSADHVVIATGAEPSLMEIEGGELLTTSEGFLTAEGLPELVIFVGGGYISFEFAHIAAHSGATAVVLEAADRPLRRFDPELVRLLSEQLLMDGVEVHVDSPVHSVKRFHDMLVVTTGRFDNQLFEARMAVHGAGRVPAVEDLGLEEGNVSFDGRTIHLNEYLQSVSNPAVYVAGDANARSLPLTPVAEMEARAVIDNIVNGNRTVPDYSAIPSVLYTTPKLASVGLSESEAKSAGGSTIFRDTSGTKSTRRLGYNRSAFKILVDGDGEKLLGAHFLGHNVDEVVNLFALAIRQGIGLSDLRRVVSSFPTVTHNILRYL